MVKEKIGIISMIKMGKRLEIPMRLQKSPNYEVLPPKANQPSSPTAEKDRDLNFGMSVHHEGLFGAIEAIFEYPPLN